MQTYILARSTEEIFPVMSMGEKLTLMQDCMKIGCILFRKCDFWEERLMYIPVVAMWEGHEVAFLQYWSDLGDALHNEAHVTQSLVMHELVQRDRAVIRVFKDDIWGEDHDPDAEREHFQITNPLLTATDNFILSQWVQFIRDYPQYAALRPDITDLGMQVSYSWT